MEERMLPISKEDKQGILYNKTIPVVTFNLGNFLFGFYAEKVMEINKDLDITPVPLAPMYILGIMNLRGQIITVIDLAKKINFKFESHPRVNLIVRGQDEALGFLVEKINDILEIPENRLEDPPEKIEGFDKNYIDKIYQLPDKLLTILSVEKLLEN